MDSKLSQANLAEKIIELSNLVSKQIGDSGNADKFTQIIEAAKKSDFDTSLSLLIDDVSVLLNADPNESEVSLNLLFVILINLPALSSNSLSSKAIKQISSSSAGPLAILKSLNNFYNLQQIPLVKYEIFDQIATTCIAENLIESVLQPHFVNLLELSSEWELSLEQKQGFFEKLSSAAFDAGLLEDALDIERLLLTKIYSAGSPKSIELASKIIIRLLNQPGYFQFDNLINLEAVHSLSKINNGNPSIEYSILSIFVSGNSSKWVSFLAENSSESISNLNIDIELASYKIQMISLAAIGAQELGKNISYDKVSSLIFENKDSITDLDIELIIIDTIKYGLINAKIDQLNRTFIVTRSIHREFGTNEWKLLSSHLKDWSKSLNDLIPVIQNAKLVAQLSNSSAPAIVEISN
ncbi:Eukaryotic translation initiation factor 3 subunit M [Smittium mucronatum]|uniref:Eukaryotic translation initiation factor 3 subunit M n=1 Tax=Smittium mucronatum TaxID=133383 RepID=A0A1R0H131_9FUNG|nr:Eukaryotic translation initiation factor 3 subunit M [Smittium mucronatum]